MRGLAALATLALAVWTAAPAAALLIDADDDGPNRRAPADDPGWAYVGSRGGPTAIYLGHGWVLTARHVGSGDVEFDGVRYPPVRDGLIQLDGPDPSAPKPYLAVFRIDPSPDLPPLPIRRKQPLIGANLVLIGNGRGRGEPIEWNGIRGYRWSRKSVKRWGTNRIHERSLWIRRKESLTHSFVTLFNKVGTPYEAQATLGDSGGAVFARDGSRWELTGVLFTVGNYPSQEATTSLYGNFSNAADLTHYRDQIQALIAPVDEARPGLAEVSRPAPLADTEPPEASGE